jgi:hypothetical protein
MTTKPGAVALTLLLKRLCRLLTRHSGALNTYLSTVLSPTDYAVVSAFLVSAVAVCHIMEILTGY